MSTVVGPAALRIAPSHAMPRGPLGEHCRVVVEPLGHIGRTSAEHLALRVDLVRWLLAQAAYSIMHEGAIAPTAEALRRTGAAVAAMRRQVATGNAPDLPGLLCNAGKAMGTAADDEDAANDIGEIAYTALVHCLCSMEARQTLADLGPRYHLPRMQKALKELEAELTALAAMK